MQTQPHLFSMTAQELIALLQPPKKRPRWTQERDSLALSLKRQNYPTRYIAKRLNVTPDAAAKRLWRLERARLIELQRSREFWNVQRRDILIRLWNAGTHTTRQLAFEFGGGWRYLGQKTELPPTNSAICGKLKRLRDAGFVLRTTEGR